MLKLFTIIFLFLFSPSPTADFQLPIETDNRTSTNELSLTAIGEFGLRRTARPGIAAHFHTGIDIKRPSNNYIDEPIFPIYEGVVISKRDDGAYAQLIVEHPHEPKFWTVYEHIAGIRVDLFDEVNPNMPIARFMNTDELNKYGWQFDHFHFEVLKEQPMQLKREASTPDRLFSSYTLVSYTKEDLNKYFYDPLRFLEEQMKP